MRTKFVIAAAATCAMAALPAHSATLTLGAGWEPFYYVNPAYPDPFGGSIYDYYTGDLDFTFTLTTGADLRITDDFYNLDMFDLVVNDVSTSTSVDEGPTSTPNPAFAYTDDFNVAFSSSYFSHGSYLLGPGTYDVTGTAIYSPYGEGVGGIEIAVPEPAAWAMMLIGFGAIGALSRRRARQSGATT